MGLRGEFYREVMALIGNRVALEGIKKGPFGPH